MEALDIGRVLAIVKEAGIATFVVVLSAYLLINGLKLVGQIFKSSDNRWDDLIDISQEQLKVQREGYQRIADLTLTMQAGFSQVREELDQKIDTLQDKIEELDAEIKHILLLVGEDKADG